MGIRTEEDFRMWKKCVSMLNPITFRVTFVAAVGWSVQYDSTTMVDKVMGSSHVHDTYTPSVTEKIIEGLDHQ